MQRVSFDGRAIAPSKIVCVARNYVAHIHELGNEVPSDMPVFMKPNSAISRELRMPRGRCRYETEICLLIENGGIAGVGVGLDLTLVDVQRGLKERGLPWERAKAYDGAATFSKFVLAPETLDELRLTLHIGDELRQDGGVELMIYKPAEILADLSESFTLEDGDIVMTGTPQGVGDLVAGELYVARLHDGNAVMVEQQWTAG